MEKPAVYGKRCFHGRVTMIRSVSSLRRTRAMYVGNAIHTYSVVVPTHVVELTGYSIQASSKEEVMRYLRNQTEDDYLEDGEHEDLLRFQFAEESESNIVDVY